MWPDDLDVYATRIHDNAVAKGFWEAPQPMDQIAAKLALLHSEVTEILEALRKDKGPEATALEFADVIIRLLDLWRVCKENGQVEGYLADAVLIKMRANEYRPALHGHRWG